MDEWCAKYEACPQATQAAREAYRIIKDCKTCMVGMQYEIEAINESAAGHIQVLQEKIARLEQEIEDISANDNPIHPSVQPSISRKWRVISERIDAGEPEHIVMDDYGLKHTR
jgi:SMC interacting uncharacterized protein involved in chromosome segregation